jgi:hypothetical protein
MLFKKDLVLGQEYLAFLLLNLFDLFLTGYIFKHEGMEANQVAVFILKYGGLSGFALYKFLMVVVIVVLCEAIAIASVPKARVVVMIGCGVYLCVILWEAYLIFSNISLPAVAHQTACLLNV